jgi:hypothetical protein
MYCYFHSVLTVLSLYLKVMEAPSSSNIVLPIEIVLHYPREFRLFCFLSWYRLHVECISVLNQVDAQKEVELNGDDFISQQDA